MDENAEFDNSEWQVRHRHEVATLGRATGFVTATDAQHNHDMQVLLDRLDVARMKEKLLQAELDIAKAEIVALRIISVCEPPFATPYAGSVYHPGDDDE